MTGFGMSHKCQQKESRKIFLFWKVNVDETRKWFFCCKENFPLQLGKIQRNSTSVGCFFTCFRQIWWGGRREQIWGRRGKMVSLEGSCFVVRKVWRNEGEEGWGELEVNPAKTRETIWETFSKRFQKEALNETFEQRRHAIQSNFNLTKFPYSSFELTLPRSLLFVPGGLMY